MEALARHDVGRRIAATIGVIGSVALAYYYVLEAALTVPTPVSYLFFVTWFVLVILAVFWWHRQPWRSFAVPIIGFVAAIALLWFGAAYLGWGP